MPLLVAPFLASHYISGIFHRFVVTLRHYKVHSKLEFHIQFYFFLLYKFRLNLLFGKLMCVCEGGNLIFLVSFTPSLPLSATSGFPETEREALRKRGKRLWTGVKAIWPLLEVFLFCSSCPTGQLSTLGKIQKRSRC